MAMATNITFAQNYTETNGIIIKHLDLGVTLGTDGIGVDLSAPVVENWVNVRAGFTYMPRFNATMHFGFEAGDASMTQDERDEQFNKLSGMLHDMIGTTVEIGRASCRERV